MNVKIWHNPRCSKSRAALELLERANVDLTIVRYLEQPPTQDELEQALLLLDIEPRQLMRTGEPIYKQLGLSDPAKTHAELLEALVLHPILLERPVVLSESRAVIARPPERALEILK